MIIKVKCWNNELKVWDECAYPLFKGMNPCEIIGFQDNEGSDKLIVDGNAVVLYSGVNDKDNVELYQDDICLIDSDDSKLYVVQFNEYQCRWQLHRLKDGTVTKRVRVLAKELSTSLLRVGSLHENDKLLG